METKRHGNWDAPRYALAFEFNPPVKTYQFTAYVLGAVMANGDCGDVLLENEYNELIWSDSERGHLMRFHPHIAPTTFAKHGLGVQTSFHPTSDSDLLAAVIASIKSGYYVRLLVDEFHIPERWCYLRHHRLHDILVVGVDIERGYFELAGYTSAGRFGKTLCDLNQMCMAYFGVGGKIHAARFVAFKYDPKASRKLDKEAICRALKRFIGSEPPSGHRRDDGRKDGSGMERYGASVFECLEAYVEQNGGRSRLDRRPFSIVVDYAVLMRRRAMRLGLRGSAGAEGWRSSNTVFDENESLARSLKMLSMLPSSAMTSEHIGTMRNLCKRLKSGCIACAEVMGGIAARVSA